MSKSSLIILLLVTPVAFLAATARHHTTGGVRLGGNVPMSYEANADVMAVREDIQGLQDQAARTPRDVRTFCSDAADNFKTLTDDVKARTDTTARRLAESARLHFSPTL